MEFEKDMPLGLTFQMAMNGKAMEEFGRMTEEEQKQILEEAKNVQTKEQMKSIVDNMGKAK